MTYQRPAYEEVTIAHGGSTVTLRPSLRAAVTLEARYSFPAMFRALEEGNLTIISEIILVSSRSGNQNAAAFLSSLSGRPLLPFFLAVCNPLHELVHMFVPAPVQQADKQPRTGKALQWPDAFRNLYRVATGQLGWTPEAAWNATPSEINEAFIGHEAKTTSNAPDPEQAERNIAEGLDPEFDRAGLRALKIKIAGGA